MKPSPLISSILCLSLLASGLIAQSTPPKDPNEPMIELQLPNHQITEVLAYYQQLTGKKLIKDPNLAGPPLSIVHTSKMPKSEAIRMIESALLLAGYAIIPGLDDSAKIVNSKAGGNPRSEGVRLFSAINDLPEGDQIVSFFLQFNHLTANEALMVIQPQVALHPPYGAVVPAPTAQALIVTETTPVIRQLVKLRELIDVPPAAVQSEFIQLERADAEKVAESVNKLLEARKASAQAAQQGAPGLPSPNLKPGSERGFVVGDTQITPDPRTNRILVVSRPSNLPTLRELIKGFDVESKLMDPVAFPLKYVTASDILPSLQALIAEAEPGKAGAPAPAQPQQQPQRRNTSSGSERGERLGNANEDLAPETVLVGKTKLVANKRDNVILVMGPPESVQKVRMFLKETDVRPLQVYLATVIGQLTLGKGSEIGVDLLQKYANQANIASGLRTRGGAADSIVDPKTLTTPGAFPLPTGLTLYGSIGSVLNTYVKLLESSNKFKVLSRPQVTTTNNKKAIISSGQEVPVPTSSLTSLTGASTNSSSVTSNIDFKKVELRLEVIPTINKDREVMLQIAQNNDSVVGSTTIGGNSLPTIASQTLNTTIMVNNNETIVLGGLITNNSQVTTTGAPWISRVPILGLLFKDTTKSDTQTELIVMIQPMVYSSPDEMRDLSEGERARTSIGSSAKEMTTPIRVAKPVEVVSEQPIDNSTLTQEATAPETPSQKRKSGASSR